MTSDGPRGSPAGGSEWRLVERALLLEHAGEGSLFPGPCPERVVGPAPGHACRHDNGKGGRGDTIISTSGGVAARKKARGQERMLREWWR